MNNNMRRIINRTIALAMILFAVACHNDEILDYGGDAVNPAVGADEIAISLNVVAPDPVVVDTRAVDPDGKGVQTMTIFCFDEHGLFISTASAKITHSSSDDLESGGILNAVIPNTTRIMHFVGNQNMSQFSEANFVHHHEEQLLSVLEGSAGMLVYWARVEVPENVKELYPEAGDNRTTSEAILDWITIETNPTTAKHKNIAGKNNPLILLRNQAKVTVVSEGSNADSAGREWNGDKFTVTGFTVCNTQAFGTVAPYNDTYGYPSYFSSTFTPEFTVDNKQGASQSWLNTNYITLPENKDKLSDIMDVDTGVETFVFETENSSADPVDVIIRGINSGSNTELYYRATLTDSEGEQVKIRRNHHYKITIDGALRYGVPTFEEALNTPATNNVWLSISDEVKSVQNSDYKLTVEQTRVVNNANDVTSNDYSISLDFNVESLKSGVSLSSDNLHISWVEQNQDVSNTYNNSLVVGSNVSFNTSTGKGSISLNLNVLPNDKDVLEGTLLVKYGQLQRKIRVVTVRTQSFVPSWVSSQVYGTTDASDASRSNVTLMFTIPEDCPEELFPMDVLITSNELDVRNNAGQVLPIIRKGQDGYGITGVLNNVGGVDIMEQGYKYVLEIDKPGKHYVYMWNILSQSDKTQNYVTIEAQNFTPLTKVVTYAAHQNVITVGNVQTAESQTGNAKDNVYYMYVAPKRGAVVPLRIDLEDVNGNDVPYGELDEYLLYSRYLSHYNDSEYSEVKSKLPNDDWMKNAHNLTDPHQYFPCQFLPIDESQWGTGGRVYAFMPRKTYIDLFHESANTDHHKSNFSLYMHTNRAASAEMIRISSNNLSSKAAFSTSVESESATHTEVYKANTGNTLYKDKGEVNTYRSMIFELRNYPDFRFNAQVNGYPSYSSSPNLSDDAEPTTTVEVPYGPNREVTVSFDVKSYKYNATTTVDPFGEEFKIYIYAPTLKLADGETKVVADPNREGQYIYTVAANATDARVEVEFVTRESVSSGEISISADPEAVSFKSKSFVLQNAPIEGKITYAASSSASGTNVPKGQFVSFIRVLDGSRIGSMVVGDNGQYQLRLRKEYDFTWDGQDDKIKLYVQIGGKYYSANFANLKALYEARDVKLVLEE